MMKYAIELTNGNRETIVLKPDAITNPSDDIRVFNNSEYGELRTMMIDGEPWFVGKDVATALGYSNASKAVIDHVEPEDKRFQMVVASDSRNGNLIKTAFISIKGFSRGNDQVSIVNEPGWY